MNINGRVRTHRGSCWFTPALWMGWGKAGGSRFAHLDVDFLFWGASINVWWKPSKKLKPAPEGAQTT